MFSLKSWLRTLCAAAIVCGSAASASAFEWVSKIDLSVEQDSQLVRDLPNNGFVPIYSKVTVGAENKLSIDVVYAKPLDVEWQYRRYDDYDYGPKAEEFVENGFKLVSHQTYLVENVTWHCAIWHKAK
ncbi:MAG: hypothetical protein JNL96_18630 [Planctomycetaceae bacterium]|nr:hypothetical protein [Planctomycetaceae bacterium]